MKEHNPHNLPVDIAIPENDGKADHLEGLNLPSISLKATSGDEINLSKLTGDIVLFIYPRTGRPGQLPLVENWNQIPGARGCTPQTCGYRDLFQEYESFKIKVFGMSTQSSVYQSEACERLKLPFWILSDEDLSFSKFLNLPLFEVKGVSLQKRMSLFIRGGVIKKVFYPCFPPDQSALTVLNWFKENRNVEL